MELYNPSVIRAIKNKYGFRFSKSLGQNFLTDKSVIDDICDGAGIGPDDLVIEIGPGIGVLTQAAAERAGRVIAIELDSNLIEILSDTLSAYDNVKVINENVLKIDLGDLIAREKGDLNHVKIIGNLPYYITTQIIMLLLEEHAPAESITIMMQKEVAERIDSDPGSRIYGALSVAVQYRCAVTVVRQVSRDSFMPAPKVDSTVLRLDLLSDPPVCCRDEKMFFRCVRAGFGQRRKTLSNSLGALGYDKDIIRRALAQAEIDPARRAETLSLQDFANLSDAFVELAIKGGAGRMKRN